METIYVFVTGLRKALMTLSPCQKTQACASDDSFSVFPMRIAMLISGGVDSSVALRLLVDAGHDVTAFYLKIWLEDELAFLGECPWDEDLQYVRAVCDEAGVPLEVVPFQKEYWDRVVRYAIDEVRVGRTPNPDMLCNARIKFGAFYDFLVREYPDCFDKIATGHYARIQEQDGLAWLKRSPDPIKDQTYFLSQLSQEQVSRAMFPIGHLRKSEVRALAGRYDLPNATRKDSQGICFLGKIAFDRFLEHHLGKCRGDIVDAKTGEKVGEHDGFWYYTIGQRRGIRLSGGPWYVVGKNPMENTVYVSNAWRSEETARDTFAVERLNWIVDMAPTNRELSVKIRHGEGEYQCEIERVGDDGVRVRLAGFDAGVAPGQFAVFYDGEHCLGGGVIVEEEMVDGRETLDKKTALEAPKCVARKEEVS